MGETIIKVPGEIKETIELGAKIDDERIEDIIKRIEMTLKEIERKKLLNKIKEFSKEIKNIDSRQSEGELYEWISSRY